MRRSRKKRMKKFLVWLQNNIAPYAGRFLFRLLMLTVRVRVINLKHQEWQYSHREKTGIYCFWHGNLLVPYHKHRNRGVHIVISRHRDGELISRIVEKGGYIPVRGSSTRGGMRAMKELLRLAEEGDIIAFTPDGPRGPARKFKDGPVYLSKTTGAPIYLMGVGFSNCWQVKDWSGMKIPKPFSTIALSYVGPYNVASDATETELEEWKEKLALELDKADAEAERIAKLKEWSE
ncbi:MAG: hypothetical protein DRP79_01640 [Planctomycetota bacterium]|nr:MAG: hypothetical protein DRP79_01640 [Planctomycetota bacterium]